MGSGKRCEKGMEKCTVLVRIVVDRPPWEETPGVSTSVGKVKYKKTNEKIENWGIETKTKSKYTNGRHVRRGMEMMKREKSG